MGRWRRRVASGRDSEQYVVHVKGLEVAMHDPRGMRPMLENYPITPTGGDHTGAVAHRDVAAQHGRACAVPGVRRAARHGARARRHRLGCDRRGNACGREPRPESGATVQSARGQSTAADDRLPKRLHEPLLKGPLSDKRLPEEEVRSIVTEYYAEQGWDTDDGRATARHARSARDRGVCRTRAWGSAKWIEPQARAARGARRRGGGAARGIGPPAPVSSTAGHSPGSSKDHPQGCGRDGDDPSPISR